jgi:hypothetical protein
VSDKAKQAFGALAGWQACLNCKLRLKPDGRRTTRMCVACANKRIKCAACKCLLRRRKGWIRRTSLSPLTGGELEQVLCHRCVPFVSPYGDYYVRVR